MDIVRILLVYLSATMAASLQAAPTPRITPVPTAVVTPAPTVTATPETFTETPAPTAEPEATPAPTAAVTPLPGPTITPNRAYRNLAQGARGAEVRRLQERLIELGYLPEGSADGAYGGKTRNAVRKFQANNGLTQDGIAGRTTQTQMFENPNVVFNPGASPKPTATPGLTEAPEPAESAKPTETTEAPTATEAPKATATVNPTEAPTATEAPKATATVNLTEAPTATEAPKATATVNPTEAPTATEAPKATATVKPVEAPTATEAPKATATVNPAEAQNPVETAAPARAQATNPTTEAVYVDLDLEGFEEIEGSVAVNDGGAPLSWTGLEDGVTVRKTPRLRQREDQIWVSLEDMSEAMEGWVMTRDENGTLVLEAEGHTIAVMTEESGPVAAVNGTERAVTAEDFDFVDEGCFINANFLASLFGGEATWVPEEKTLMLRLPARVLTEATD